MGGADPVPVAVTALPHTFTVPSSNAAIDRFPAPSTPRTSASALTAVGVYRCVPVEPSPICPELFNPHDRSERLDPMLASACWAPPARPTTPASAVIWTGFSRARPLPPVPSPIWPLVLSPHAQTVPSAFRT